MIDSKYSSNFTLSQDNRSIQSIVARLSFALFLFFIFFGTKLPFRDFVDDLQDIGTSNKANQIIFGLLFISSCFSLSNKIPELFILIKKEKFLFLFLIWCFVSIFWSDFKLETFKALFLITTSVLVCIAFLLHVKTLDDIIIYFKIILSVYLVVSLISVFTIPGATDPKSGTWRGLANGKNNLGQVALLNMIIWFDFFKRDASVKKYLSLTMVLISAILLVGARSMTCILISLIIIFFAVLFSIDKILQRLSIGRVFSSIAIFSVLGMIISTLYFFPETTTFVFDSIGKDPSFTGRTDLWEAIFIESKSRFPIGCGYAGFWVVENINLLNLYETFVWLPNQAHNGYLDIINETGLVGLIILILMVVFFFKNSYKLKFSNTWKWLVFAILILNFQETTLFRARHVPGSMFIFVYFLSYVELVFYGKLHQTAKK